MRLLSIVRVFALVCTGLVAGIFLGYYVSAPARGALSPSSFVQHQQIVHLRYAVMMPPLISAAVLAGIAWLLLVKSRWRSVEFWLVAASVAGIAFVIVLTRVVNVPLNDQLMTWNVAEPPNNVSALWATWERAHMMRTVAAVVAFVLAAIAIALAASRNSVRPPLN